jgi:ABC-type glycerol-3-phosphate transport system substrate-binding protein
MTKFQAILIAVFVIFIIIGVAVFATYKGSQNATALPTIEVWGTFSNVTFSQLVQNMNVTRAEALKINYVQKAPAQFSKDFIETLARGGGPDAILLPQEMLLKHIDKIIPIPATILSSRTFKDTYVQQAELYINTAGILALPFSVDPLVMYWNRDMFTNAGIPSYPKYWDEFSNIGKYLTVKDENSNIRKSALALGEFRNITHAREVFGALLMQAGNPVVRVTQQPTAEGFVDVAASALADGSIRGSESTNATISFFTRFSNPADPDYSWNRSLSQSQSAFLSGNLATYFGFASELAGMRGKNPNLNFDVASLPQARKGALRATYGTMYGLSIVRSSPDPTATYNVLANLVAPEALTFLSKTTYLPPVRRDLISLGNADSYMANFYDSALISRAWLDPNTQSTADILQEMIETVTSGRKNSFEAIKDADTKLNTLIRNM